MGWSRTVAGTPRHAARPGHDALTVAELVGREPTPTPGSARPGAGGAESAAGRSSGSADWQQRRRAATSPVRRQLALAAVVVVTFAAAATVFILFRPSGVSAATPIARIALTTSRVRMGECYVATAAGFTPGEQVRFSWTGPTNGEMGVFPADSSGNTGVRGPILEKDPPGSYQIIATGLGSGRVTSAPLQVLPPP
jgi:hypothetical protein